MHWEVEQKFRIRDRATVEAKLSELKVQFAAPQHQADRYFNHPARDFGKTDEALRIRRIGDDAFVTYKGPKIDSITKTRRELEFRLPPSSSNEEFAELLLALGFRDVATVRKARQIGHLQWQGFPIEIALDEVDQIGSFLEIEIVADDSTLSEAKSAVASLSQRLETGPNERRSYLELLLEKNVVTRCS
jgi:adenylate cyclase, class 2